MPMPMDDVARAILAALELDTLDALLAKLSTHPVAPIILQDSVFWCEMILRHFKARRPYLPSASTLSGSPARLMPCAVCAELEEFSTTVHERQRFIDQLHIVNGDIGTVTQIRGIPIDGIAFPTNELLENRRIGAAKAVFQRAGPDLTKYLLQPGRRGSRYPVGSAIATPSFAARVSCLIHCVGPYVQSPDVIKKLAMTYRNLLQTAARHQLHCVAVASISTGALRVPLATAAIIALRALQRELREMQWRGTIGIVCVDPQVLAAFQRAHAIVLDSYNDMALLN